MQAYHAKWVSAVYSVVPCTATQDTCKSMPRRSTVSLSLPLLPFATLLCSASQITQKRIPGSLSMAIHLPPPHLLAPSTCLSFASSSMSVPFWILMRLTTATSLPGIPLLAGILGLLARGLRIFFPCRTILRHQMPSGVTSSNGSRASLIVHTVFQQPPASSLCRSSILRTAKGTCAAVYQVLILIYIQRAQPHPIRLSSNG